MGTTKRAAKPSAKPSAKAKGAKAKPKASAKGAEAIVRAIDALGDDFRVFSSRTSPPDDAALDAAEAALGRRLPADYRALLARLGPLAIEVDAAVWARPEEFDVRPAWQMDFGLVMFGVASGAPASVDVVAQTAALAREDDSILAVLRRVIGDGDVWGYDEDGRFVRHARDGGIAPTEGLFAVLLAEIERLREGRERLRDEPIEGRDPDAPPMDLRRRHVRAFTIRKDAEALLRGLRDFVTRLRARVATLTVEAEHEEVLFDVERDALPPTFLDGTGGSLDLRLVFGRSGPLDDDHEVFVSSYPRVFSSMIRTLADPSLDASARAAVEDFVAALTDAGLAPEADA